MQNLADINEMIEMISPVASVFLNFFFDLSESRISSLNLTNAFMSSTYKQKSPLLNKIIPLNEKFWDIFANCSIYGQFWWNYVAGQQDILSKTSTKTLYLKILRIMQYSFFIACAISILETGEHFYIKELKKKMIESP